MKKLATLLALVLTCNIFAASSLVSAADGDLFFFTFDFWDASFL